MKYENLGVVQSGHIVPRRPLNVHHFCQQEHTWSILSFLHFAKRWECLVTKLQPSPTSMKEIIMLREFHRLFFNAKVTYLGLTYCHLRFLHTFNFPGIRCYPNLCTHRSLILVWFILIPFASLNRRSSAAFFSILKFYILFCWFVRFTLKSSIQLYRFFPH